MPAKKSETEARVPFENAMQRLETIVAELEDGDLSLEKSLTSFEEGMHLAKVCEDRLSEASGRVEKIMKDFSGDGKRVPLTDEELRKNLTENDDV